MSIKYYLAESNLQPGKYYIRVVGGNVIPLEEMLNNIIVKTSLSSADVLAVIYALREEITAILASGDVADVTGLARFRVGLEGGFDTPEATVTKDKASLKIRITPTADMVRDVAQRATYKQLVHSLRSPEIVRLYDFASHRYDCYTAGGIIRLTGKGLNFHEERADEGVFVDNGTEEIRLTVYSAVTDRRIDALLPPTVTGELTIRVCARYAADGQLREGVYRHRVPST